MPFNNLKYVCEISANLITTKDALVELLEDIKAYSICSFLISGFSFKQACTVLSLIKKTVKNSVVAVDNINNADQIIKLRKLGCTYVVFGPMPIDKLDNLTFVANRERVLPICEFNSKATLNAALLVDTNRLMANNVSVDNQVSFVESVGYMMHASDQYVTFNRGGFDRHLFEVLTIYNKYYSFDYICLNLSNPKTRKQILTQLFDDPS